MRTGKLRMEALEDRSMLSASPWGEIAAPTQLEPSSRRLVAIIESVGADPAAPNDAANMTVTFPDDPGATDGSAFRLKWEKLDVPFAGEPVAEPDGSNDGRPILWYADGPGPQPLSKQSGGVADVRLGGSGGAAAESPAGEPVLLAVPEGGVAAKTGRHIIYS